MADKKDFIDGKCENCGGKLFITGTVEKESEDDPQKFKLKCNGCGRNKTSYLTVEGTSDEKEKLNLSN